MILVADHAFLSLKHPGFGPLKSEPVRTFTLHQAAADCGPCFQCRSGHNPFNPHAFGVRAMAGLEPARHGSTD